MLGRDPIASVLGSGVDPTDHAAVKSYARELCRLGLSVLLIAPGGKLPADPRTPGQRKAANTAARKAAREAGHRGWEKVVAPSGLTLATSDATRLGKYIDNYVARYADRYAPEPVPINLAIEVGGSRLVVADCDNAAQRLRFLADFAGGAVIEPTVLSPGTRDDAGEWIHTPDGGHFYFTLPDDVTLPTVAGSVTVPGEDGYAILWDRRYVLIPPSSRTEGRYEQVGDEYPLPAALLDAIVAYGELRAERAALGYGDDYTPGNTDLAGSVDAWAESVSWADLLDPLEWTPTARADTCGCAVWTAPGSHASSKSATTHDAGCSLGRYTFANAPMHLWTDNPGQPFESNVDADGRLIRTVSKLQVAALSRYGGNIADALDDLGLVPTLTKVDLGPEFAPRRLRTAADDDNGTDRTTLADPIPDAVPPPATEPDEDSGEGDDAGLSTDTTTPDDDDETADPDYLVTDTPGVPFLAPFDHWRDMPPPEYLVEGLLENGALTMMIGPPGVGKSSVALDLACHVALGRRWQGRRTLKTRVLYLPGEGLTGVVQRVIAWEQAHGANVGRDLIIGKPIIQLIAKPEAWGELCAYITARDIGLVVFDTFARMALQIEENSATDVGLAVGRYDALREKTSAGVLVVHHTGKHAPTVARGSSALNGAIDTELLVGLGGWYDDDTTPPTGKPLELTTTKQKNLEQDDDPLPLMMMSWPTNREPLVTAPLITGPSGNVDPMVGEVVYSRPRPEPIIETMVRLRQYIDRVPQQGATRADLVANVNPDGFTARRANAPKHWKALVAEAIDRALAMDLVQTLSGTPAGSRYVPGPVGIEAARLTYYADTGQPPPP